MTLNGIIQRLIDLRAGNFIKGEQEIKIRVDLAREYKIISIIKDEPYDEYYIIGE